MNWKKRGRKGWTGKKYAKNETKGSEREYGKQEVRQQLQEDFEGDNFRYTGGKKKRNLIARRKNWIKWYQRRIQEEELREERAKAKGESYRSWSYFSTSHCRSRIEELEKEIEELKQKEQKNKSK